MVNYEFFGYKFPPCILSTSSYFTQRSKPEEVSACERKKPCLPVWVSLKDLYYFFGMSKVCYGMLPFVVHVLYCVPVNNIVKKDRKLKPGARDFCLLFGLRYLSSSVSPIKLFSGCSHNKLDIYLYETVILLNLLFSFLFLSWLCAPSSVQKTKENLKTLTINNLSDGILIVLKVLFHFISCTSSSEGLLWESQSIYTSLKCSAASYSSPLAIISLYAHDTCA